MNAAPVTRFHHLLAATLAIGSVFPVLSPVLAQTTTAGTAITNTATGTFSDGTTTYNTTSNQVTITVSEIAGVTLTAQPPSVANPNAGDSVTVNFVITNTGNDPTQFFIPGIATLSNTTDFAVEGIKIIAVNGNATSVNVPAAGASTETLLSNPTIPAYTGTGSAGTVTVQVTIRALPSATAGGTTTVALGNTATPNGQNVDRAGNISTNDLYTVDNANGVGGETNTTAPSNGTREAMATSSSIAVAARLQSFAAVLKAVGSYTNNGTPNILSDDVLTYRLALKIDNPTTPPAGFVASDLYGTRLDVNNSTATPYVLVSDAIPAGLQLGAPSGITAPANWTPVYTQDPLTTTAQNAKWTTTRPTSGAPITRIGFIYDTSTTPLPKGPVTTGTVISGFAVAMTPISSFTGGQVANIAQVFGQSQPGTVAPGTATQLVYDESGDQTTNNGLGGTNPDPTTTGGAPTNNGGISDGVANPAADGTDSGNGNDPTNTGNTNQGADNGPNAGTKPLGGEVNVYTIAATPLNGPNGQPGAVGPTDTNDDFTNKSIVVPANKNPADPLTDAETPEVTFTNTVQNTSGAPQVISLLPTPPATPADLLDGTKVRITDPVSGRSATYTYTAAGGFVFSTGTGTTATQPVTITVPAGGTNTAQYQTIVDLPDAAPQLRGFPVPVIAFVDTNGDGQPTGEPSNTTIDRLYTNYVSLLKEARILEADGTTQVVGFTIDQTALGVAATPGRIIEYRITYRNISSAGGTNSVTLPANNLVIIENGSAGTNNWFTSTFDPKYPTSGGVGSAIDANGTITVTISGGDIQEYRDTVPKVDPGTAAGTFIFQRRIR